MRLIPISLGFVVFLVGCAASAGSEEGAANFDEKREQAAKEMQEFKPPSPEESAANEADGRTKK